MFLEDVPKHIKTTLFLSGKDEIVNSEKVKNGIERNPQKNVDLIYKPELSHAALLTDLSVYRELRTRLSRK